MAFEELVGEKITAVYWNDDILQFVTASGACLMWGTDADCCAHAFFFQLENLEWLIDEVVTGVRSNDLNTNDDGNYIDCEFSHIATRKGEASIELRVEHNGYYAGRAVFMGESSERLPEKYRVA